MAAIDLARLRERLTSPNFDDSDIEQAELVLKGLRDGSLRREDLNLPADWAPQPEPVAKGVEAAVEAVEPTAPEAVEGVVDDSDLVQPGDLRKAIETSEEGVRAINAIPVLNAMVEQFDRMVADQAATRELVKGLASQFSGIQKSLANLSAPAQPAQPNEREQAARQQVGSDTVDAIKKALEATGIIEQIQQLDEQVNRRPWSGNPPRNQQLRKGLGNGRPQLNKGQAEDLIRKSLAAGRITEDQACEAWPMLDMVPAAQRAGQDVTYADIVARVDRKTLEEYAG